MIRKAIVMFIIISSLLLLIACNNDEDQSKDTTNSTDALSIITTFTLLEDIVNQIGGEHIDVYNLVPTGTDPHEYEPLPEDMAKVEEADLIFYNGLNLEGDEAGWFAKLIEATGQDWDNTYMVSEGIEPKYLDIDEGREKAVNPHSFLDPVNGMTMAENVRDALIEADPENEELYEQKANDYLQSLKEIDEQYKEKIAEIPKENRILVTSERAYQYMTARYGLKEGFIWEVDTEENGTPEQITSLINFINEHKPPVLFVETNVDKRPMETVSAETDIDIYGEIYSDEIGKPGEDGDTYIKFLQHNIEIIYQGLMNETN